MILKLTSFLCVSLFVLSPVVAQEPTIAIAKVDYSKIEHLVESVVLARPENQELGMRIRDQREQAERFQKRIQESMLKGEKINLKGAAFGAMNQSEDLEKIETLSEKFLLEVIEKVLDDKYQLVLKESYTSSLLYTKIPIDDVTLLLKQELLRQIPTQE